MDEGWMHRWMGAIPVFYFGKRGGLFVFALVGLVSLRRKPSFFPTLSSLSCPPYSFPYCKETPDAFRLFGVVLLFFHLWFFYYLVFAKPRDGVGWHKIGRRVSSGE